jgi:hypothetical protein
MSQENVELVRRGIRSVDAFWALLDEDVTWDLGESPPVDLHGVYVGRDAVIEASRHYWGTWANCSIDAEELIDAGSSVVVVSTNKAVVRPAELRSTDTGRKCGPFGEAGSSDGSSSRTRPPPSESPGCRSRRHTYAAATGIVYGGRARPTERGSTRGSPGSLKSSAFAWKVRDLSAPAHPRGSASLTKARRSTTSGVSGKV